MSNYLSKSKQAHILSCLVEGTSVSATARIAHTTKVTVLRLLSEAGKVALLYSDQAMKDLPCERIEIDELWAFIYAKEYNLPKIKAPPKDAGEVWTWVAFCPDTKLVPCWRVGGRSSTDAVELLLDLKSRLNDRIQISTDSLQAYISAIEEVFGDEVDYAQLPKQSEKAIIKGEPDPILISTSGVERQNLTVRMACRRYTRKTNGFSKKLLNHVYAIALHYLYYNFCRVHESIGMTPAEKAEIQEKAKDIDWIVEIIEENQTKPRRPKTYKRRIRK